MKNIEFRRNVEPEKRRQNNKSLIELAELQSEYKASKINVQICEKTMENENEKLAEAASLLENARNELSIAQEEIDSDYLPEGAQPRARIQRRDELSLTVQQLEAALNVQRDYSQKATSDFFDAEKRLFNSDKQINRFAETLEDVVLAKQTIAELDQEKAKRLARIESKAAQRKEKAEKDAKEAKEAQLREFQRLEQEREKIAKKLNVTARKRVEHITIKNDEVNAAKADEQEKSMEQRIKAVISLKDNSKVVNAELAGLAAKHNKKINDAKQRLEDEKEALLSKGQNPYLAFRKKELAVEAKNRERRMKNEVDKNRHDLAERMEKEEQFIGKHEAAARASQTYERRHRESQGRHVIEERNSNYILDQTDGRVEVLDPLGKATRVYPSLVVNKTDNIDSTGFATLNSTAALVLSSATAKETGKQLTGIQRITQEIRDSMGITAAPIPSSVSHKNNNNNTSLTATDALLLRTKSAPNSSSSNHKGGTVSMAQLPDLNDADSSIGEAAAVVSVGPSMTAMQLSQLETLAAPSGAMPGSNKTALALNLNGSELEQKVLVKLAEEQEGGAGDSQQLYNKRSPRYKIPDMSKFERDALDRAKERHRERIEEGVPQIAGGKAFYGQAFVPKPSELVFKDFEVGKRYKKHFTLTNVSYTFNSFKYLDLDESVSDFFVVTFEKPGRMSAGMSCSIEIAFAPRVNKDIFTVMRFYSETGPIEVPLRCLIQRCAPRIITPEIDFGGVVIGQKVTMQFKINNTQALASKFTIYPIRSDGTKILPITTAATVAPTPPATTTTTTTTTGERDHCVRSANNNNNASSNKDDVMEVEREIEGGDGDDDMLSLIDSGSGDQHQHSSIGKEPALNETELSTRVKRVMSQVLRMKRKQHPLPLSCITTEGAVSGYDSTTVEVLCAPLTVGSIEQRFVVVFDNVNEATQSVDDLDQLVKQEQIVSVRTVGEEVPIYVAEETMDLRCTLFDRIYRKKILLRNRGKTAYRIMMKVAPRFSAFVEVNPTVFFVQAMSSQSVNIKFSPTEAMMQKLAHFTLPYQRNNDNNDSNSVTDNDNSNSSSGALILLPIEVQALNQEIPAYFTISAYVGPSSLQLSTTLLDFGKVFVGQKSIRIITVQNKSMLPQKAAFVRLKKGFTVQPNDGFALLLPNESIDFEVTFSPHSSIIYEPDLTILTSFNDTFAIKVTAEGIEPPLALSTAVVHMRTTYPGAKVIASTLIRNQTKQTQCFQVMLPDKLFSWLTVSPNVVELLPGQTSRLEIEYHPPSGADTLDPIVWHTRAISQARSLPTPVTSPFNDWAMDEAGWVSGSGLFGAMQWAKVAPRKGNQDEDTAAEEAAEEVNEVIAEVAEREAESAVAVDITDKENIVAENGNESAKDRQSEETVQSKEKMQQQQRPLSSTTPRRVMTPKEEQRDENEVVVVKEKEEEVVVVEGESKDEQQLLPAEEWGIAAQWTLPILIKPKKRSQLTLGDQSPNTADRTITGSPNKSIEFTGNATTTAVVSSPLFLTVETVVILPQLEADVKAMDFEQVSVGTRLLRSFKLFNRTSETIAVKSAGLSALGPFTLLRPIKDIPPNEARSVVVECLPSLPGLVVEVLEVYPADASKGGHRVTVSFKVQGLQPAVALEGLSPPPPNWNPRSGILDFGNILMRDCVTRRFLVRNESAFTVRVEIVRVAANKLPPNAQQHPSELMELTLSGLPIFSIRPEKFVITESATQEVEVTFRPDRNRFLPFREDLDILIGQTDEVLRVGLLGRSWDRQLVVLPFDPRDEPFYRCLHGGNGGVIPTNNNTPTDMITSSPCVVEDVLLVHRALIVRNTALSARNKTLQLSFPEKPMITLEYPDPFASDALPSSYTEIATSPLTTGTSSTAPPTKGGGGTTSATTTSAQLVTGARQQVKKLIISAIKVEDGRGGAGPGVFEVILSAEAKASNLFALSIDKGTVTPGAADIVVDITCTLAKPRSLGGIFVGSWQSYRAEVILKGGWKAEGATTEDNRVTVILKAYVSL